MAQILPLIHTIYNLKNIQRTGCNLFAGVDSRDIDSVGVHTFLVSQLCMIIGDMAQKGKVKVDMAVLLRLALYHEWGETILGDYPDRSPSYQSYFTEKYSHN